MILERVNKSNEDVLYMSSVRGKDVKNPYQLPFSFYFSSGNGVTHGPRVKPVFNSEKAETQYDWHFEALQ